jgi:hypothetical protein
VFGLLRALRDPDVQHAVGLMVAFARQFGARISDPPALADPTAAALPSAPDMRER